LANGYGAYNDPRSYYTQDQLKAEAEANARAAGNGAYAQFNPTGPNGEGYWTTVMPRPTWAKDLIKGIVTTAISYGAGGAAGGLFDNPLVSQLLSTGTKIGASQGFKALDQPTQQTIPQDPIRETDPLDQILWNIDQILLDARLSRPGPIVPNQTPVQDQPEDPAISGDSTIFGRTVPPVEGVDSTADPQQQEPDITALLPLLISLSNNIPDKKADLDFPDLTLPTSMQNYQANYSDFDVPVNPPPLSLQRFRNRKLSLPEFMS